MKSFLPFLIASILYFSTSSYAQVYVDVNAGGLNNGTSWANAYTNLQTALTNTVNGQIWVANGTYRPTSCSPCSNADRLISFNLPPGVQLYGGFAGNETLLSQRDWTTNLCILSGDIGTAIDSTDNSFRVMTIENSVITTRLDGFIIEEGNADGSSINGTFFDGGGIYLDARPAGTGHVRIHNCTIRNNFAGGGGGISIDAVQGGVVEADIRNCIFENNRASTGNVSSTGGAILMLGNSGANVSPTISDCQFINNFVGNDGAAISMTPSGATSVLGTKIIRCTFTANESTDRGGAIWYRMIQGTSNVMIRDCLFDSNVAGGQGGGVFARASFGTIANDTLLNCIFTQNQSTGTSSVNDGEGGALFMRGSQTATRNHRVLNCVFDRNYATHRGGGVATTSFFDTPSDTIGTINSHLVNCSFYGNTTDGDGGAVHANGVQGTNNMTLTNSIFWGDTAMVAGMELFQASSNVSVSYSDIAGGVPAGITDGGNNVDTEPFYNDPDNGDLRIGGCSPLVNAGNNAEVLAVQDPDPDGDQRIWGGTVDLGAYEVGIIYVDLDATGANNGTSWANAYTDLQDGINRAFGGDQVWVAEGTYRPTTCTGACTNTDRLISFQLKSGTELYGGFDATETDLSQRDWTTNFTILSGDIGTPIDSTDNTFRVVWAENTSIKTVFDGLIVEEGNADGSSINGGYFDGGAMYIDARPAGIGNLRIRNCTFRNNFAGGGGAISIDAVQGGTIEAEIRDCVFDNNRASTGNVSSTGGAILMLGNSGATVRPRIVGCTFQNNFVGNDGAAISMTPSGATSLLATKIDSCTFINNESTDRGAGIWYRMIQGTSAVKISNCTFTGNIAGGQGGGIFTRQSFAGVANDTILNCIFTQNQSTGTSSNNDGEGGGLFMRGSQTATRNHHVLNCVFDRNFATHRGGAVGTTSFFDTPSDTIGIINSFFVNCSFSQNETDGDGGAVHANAAQGTNNMTFSNSIFWNNSAGNSGNELSSNMADISLSYCDIEGGVPSGMNDVGNNLDTDPKYLDASNGNLRLEPCSPVIDIGDNSALLPEQDPDPDGNVRTFNGTVDFGAYEFNGSPAVTTPQITTNSQSICPGSSIVLSANAPGGGESGNWSVINGTGTFSPSVSSPTVTVTGLSNGVNTFGWDITNPFCDFDPVEVVITAEDNISPSAVCQDITVQLDGTGNANITGADVDGGSTDDCGISSLTVFPNAFSNGDLGNNPVTLTVFDIGGNDDICNATVTVLDAPMPMITCPSNITVNTDPFVCEAFVTVPPPTISNSLSTNAAINFDGINDYLNIGSIAGFVPGSLERSFEAWIRRTDTGDDAVVFEYGFPTSNNSHWEVRINSAGQLVLDITGITKAWNTSLNDEVWHHIAIVHSGGNLTNTTAYVDGSLATPLNNPTATPVTLNISAVGIGTVLPGLTNFFEGDMDEIRFWDDARTAGEIASNMNVELTGSESNLILYLNFNQGDPCGNNVGNSPVNDLASNPTANNAVVTNFSNVSGNPPSPCISNYSFGGPIGSFSIVNDYNNTDDASDTYPESSTLVTWTYTDLSGASANCQMTITVNDNEPPQAACQDLTVQLDGSGMATILPTQIDFGSTDNCGAIALSSLSLDQSTFNCTDLGSNLVILTVSDDLGLTSTCSANIDVLDDTPPVAICQDITINLDLTGNIGLFPNQVDGGSSDNCSIVNMAVVPNSFDCSNVGPNSVTLTVADMSNNMHSCTATVTVVDNTNPVVTCQDITVQLDGSGNASITGSDLIFLTEDNCPTSVDSAVPSSFGCSDIGSNTVILTVSDISGNMGTCSGIVEVEDNIPPVALCQDITIQLDGTGNATITPAQVDGGSTDNCSIQSSTLNISAFDINDLGPNTVILSVTDIDGNTSTCSAVVEVENNNVPNAVCQDITVQLDASGMVSISGSDVDGGSSAAAGIQSLTVSSGNFNCQDIGQNPVVLTVTDNLGTSATCSAMVTVEDTTPPTASCQNITVQLDGNGMATVAASDINNASSDNCGIQSSTISSGNFNCQDIGPNPVVLTVTDNSGNTATCSATVTVEDSTPPTAICQNITVQLDGNGMVTVATSDINNGSSDNCAIQSSTISNGNFNCQDIGSNLVVLTVTDNSGNTATCSTTVTVEDNLPPTAVCQDITVQLDGNGMATVAANDVNNASSDNCGIQSSTINNGNFNCQNIGPNAVVLTVTDNSGNTATCSTTVTVEDTTPPIAGCFDSDLIVSLDATGNFAVIIGDIDTGSSDNCGIQSSTVNPANFTCQDIGTNTVILTVTDMSGNAGTCSVSVVVQDITPPTAICQNITVQLDGNGMVTIAPGQIDGGSTDNCAIQSLTVLPDNFDTDDIGANTVILTVTDVNGNSSTCSAMVDVQNNNLPNAVCQNTSVSLDVTGNATIIASDVDGGSSAIGGIQSLTISTGNFNCQNIGQNPVVLTVTDNSGNMASCTAIVTVVDDTPPTALCQNITVQLDGSGMATIAASDINNASSDNCGIQSLTVSTGNFNCQNIGSNPVVLTATDNSGNTATCPAMVSVEDNTPPTAICQNITVQLDGNGMATLTPGQVDGGSTDICGIQSMTVLPDNFDTDDIGVNTVILTVTDVNGNSSTCSALVDVQNNNLPNAVCQNISVSLDASGNATITAADVDGGSSAVGGIQSLTISTGNFNCQNIGQNPVALTVTDNSGNMASCTAFVTVVDDTPPTALCQNVTVQLDNNGQVGISVSDINAGSSDNCGIQSTFLDTNQLDCSNVGDNPVILFVADFAGNSQTCPATVSVEDILPPTATCQNITVQLDGNGMASITASQIDGGSTDNCGIQSTTASQTNFDTNDIGANPVILTVTDVNGNSSTCSAMVDVQNNNTPNAVCQNITVQLDATGNATITAADVDGGSTAAAGIQSLTISNGNLNCQNIGPNNVILTVTDNLGSTASCTAIVTIADDAPPTAICQNITIQLDGNGMASITASQIDGGSTDNCGIQSTTASPTDFDTNDIGANPVILTVTDVNGNSATCSAMVDVQNNNTPNAVCQNITVQLDATGNATITAADVDGGSTAAAGIQSLTISNGNFNCQNIGPNNVILTVTDNLGSTASCTAIVMIADDAPPTAICQNITIQLDGNGMASITASQIDGGSNDNCGIQSTTASQTNFDTNDIGVNPVILTVTDVNGNSATCSAMVDVQNNNTPNAVCQNITVQLDATGNATITAADVDGGSTAAVGIQSLTISNGNFNCQNIGSNPVILTVTDNLGTSATCQATVTVADDTPPMAICQNITVQLDGNGIASITASQVNNGSTDNCGIQSMMVAPGTFDINDIGTNPVILTVTDVNGNTATCTANVDVQNTGLPTAFCQNITVQLDASGVAMITGSDIDNGSTVSSDTIFLYADPNTFDCNNLGDNDVTLCVMDEAGQTANCMATVTVVDVTAPTCEAQDITVQLDANGMAVINAMDLVVGPVLDMTDSGQDLGTDATNEVSLADIDNDGDLDAVIAVQSSFSPTPLSTVYFNNGGGTFTTSGTFFGPLFVRAVDVSDLDGDGDTDIVMSGTFGEPNSYFNDGAGIFSDGTNFINATNTINLTIGDLNGDCSPDVFVGNGGGSPNTVKLNNGDGTFTDSGQSLGAGVSWTVELGDVDGDGDLDAVVANTNTPDKVWINDGNGNFTDSGQSLYPGQSTGLRLGDLDGDGDLDYMVTTNNIFQPTLVYENDGNGNFTQGQSISQSNGVDVELRDFDKDGDLDAYIINSNQPDSVWLNDGSANFLNSGITLATHIGFASASGDVDGDGDFDVLVASLNMGTSNLIILNNLTGTFDGCTAFQDLIFTADPPAFDCTHIGTTQPVNLIVTDASGNSSTCSANVTVEGANILPPSCITQDITIQLDGNGMASITEDQVDNGSTGVCQPLSFDTDITDFDMTNIGPNTVVLTVSDVVGNMSTCTAIVTVEDNNMPTAVCQNITVQLDASGNATITAADVDGGSSAPSGIQSLSISTGNFNCQNIGSNPVVLTVTDNNGNTATCQAMVTVEDNLPPIALCQDVTVMLDANGGVAVPASAIDNGSTDNCGIQSTTLSTDNFNCQNIGPNTVVLTVTDDSGNTSTCDAIVTVEDNLQPTALCQNISVQLDGSGQVTIAATQIDNGSSDNCGIQSMSISTGNFNCQNVGPNNVALIVTDSNGSTSTCDAMVTVEDNSTPTMLCPQDVVSGNCTSITPVPQPVVNSLCGNFVLSNDFNGTADASGIYPQGTTTVIWTITEANGNTATCSMDVTVTSSLQAAVTATLVSCTGGNDGTATASPTGGTAPYTYAWSDPANQTDITATGLQAGLITVTITDAGGCETTAGTFVSENAPLNISLDISAPNCFDECTGIAQAIVLGGTPAYSYLWSTGQTGVIVAGLCDGDYSLTVTDALSCTQTIAFTVNEPTPIDLNQAVTDGICTVQAGSASVNPTGGTGLYTYLWNTGATDNEITGLLPGNYTVTVTDENGCEETTILEVEVLGNLTPILDVIDVACFGENDGTITAINPGDYTYAWSNGQSTATISGLGPGNYSVTMTDNLSGCTGTMAASIQENPPLMSDILTFDSSCNDMAGSAAAIVTGGSPGFTYLWSNGATTSSINNLSSGNYTITITDSAGCEEINSAFVSSENNGPVLDVFQVNVSCAGANDGSIDITVVGGAMPFTYSWTDGPAVEDRAGLSPGVYTLLINDANGCFAATTVVISQAGTLTLDMGSTPSSGNDGTAFVTVFGGVTPFTYQWSNGGNGPIINGLSPGVYSVTVTDANGCMGQAEVVVPLFTSVSEVEGLDHFDVFPNPTTGAVTIEIGFDQLREFRLTVYNVIGQKIQESSHNELAFSARIDLTRYRSGLYFISLETEEGIAVKQILVVE